MSPVKASLENIFPLLFYNARDTRQAITLLYTKFSEQELSSSIWTLRTELYASNAKMWQIARPEQSGPSARD